MREKSAESAEGAMIGIFICLSYLGGAPLVKNHINDIMEKILCLRGWSLQNARFVPQAAGFVDRHYVYKP
jgi:hypothetical protein